MAPLPEPPVGCHEWITSRTSPRRPRVLACCPSLDSPEAPRCSQPVPLPWPGVGARAASSVQGDQPHGAPRPAPRRVPLRTNDVPAPSGTRRTTPRWLPNGKHHRELAFFSQHANPGWRLPFFLCLSPTPPATGTTQCLCSTVCRPWPHASKWSCDQARAHCPGVGDAVPEASAKSPFWWAVRKWEMPPLIAADVLYAPAPFLLIFPTRNDLI